MEVNKKKSLSQNPAKWRRELRHENLVMVFERRNKIYNPTGKVPCLASGVLSRVRHEWSPAHPFISPAKKQAWILLSYIESHTQGSSGVRKRSERYEQICTGR